MSAQIRAQLNHPDPAQRRAAILALGRSKDARALPILRDVLFSEQDAALRQLAQQALEHIEQHLATPPEPAVYEPLQAYDASAIYQTREHGAVSEQAVNAQVARTQAVYDPYAERAHDDDPHAPAFLKQPPPPPSAEDQRARKKRKQRQEDRQATWGDVGLDIVLLLLVQAAGSAVTWLLVLPALFELPPGQLPLGLAVGDVVGQVVISLLATLGTLLLRMWGIFMVALLIFSAEGALPDVIHALVPVEAVTSLLYYIGLAAVAMLVNPDLLSGGPGLFEVVGFVAQHLEGIVWISVGLGLVILVYMAYRLGKALQFDTFTGLGALVLGYLFNGCVLFGLAAMGSGAFNNL